MNHVKIMLKQLKISGSLITTSGNERTRLSAAFSSTASGLKLPIFLIVPRKTDLPDYEPHEECILKYKTCGTFNDDVIVEYIDKVLIPYKLKHYFDKLYFIFDSAKMPIFPSILHVTLSGPWIKLL
jgi:hypothetical protein